MSQSNSEKEELKLLVDTHVKYILSLQEEKETFEECVVEHLKISGIYWGMCALAILNRIDSIDREKVIDYVLTCLDERTGAFGGHTGHDPHLLYTLSALQVLALFHALDKIDDKRTANWIAGLQNADGSFSGDQWGEIDTRFTYCAVSALSLLGKLDLIRRDAAVDFVISCCNFDGAFGCVPGAESHAGQVFTCVGALAILQRLDALDEDKLGWWLAERQTSAGGLNGRPEKKPDVCYSWWVLSSLSVIDKVDWINGKALVSFILKCQDPDGGGISDRPGDVVDVYHTFFGIAGLSLLEHGDLVPIDPVYALPAPLVSEMKLPK